MTQVLSGKWWLPGEEEASLLGTLTISEESVELELSSCFFGNTELYNTYNLDRIYGWINTGESVILQNCFSPQGVSMKYAVSHVYKYRDSQFVKNKSLKFHELKVELPYLANWYADGPTPIHFLEMEFTNTV